MLSVLPPRPLSFLVVVKKKTAARCNGKQHLTQQDHHHLAHLYPFPLVRIDFLAELTILIDEETPQA